MTGAQARYFSFTTYSGDPNHLGQVLTSVMDDEITTDNQGRYVIVYSRDTERPTNATSQNGVTWVNWGPTSQQAWTLRWMSVNPEWDFAQSFQYPLHPQHHWTQ